jgi:hypothetical protein
MRTASQLFVNACTVLRATQIEMGNKLGISRRTAQRWAQSGIPRHAMRDLAALVYPVDAALAAEIAETHGGSLETMGIVAPAPPSPPVVQMPAPPPPPPPPDGVVDAVVCAASDAMDMMPRDVRAGLLAAFSRAREIGVTVEMVERALRARVERG